MIIALMMEVVRTSETSVCFHEITGHFIPESCYIHIHLRENLKSPTFVLLQDSKIKEVNIKNSHVNITI
jgi:hypothetical protein